MLAFMIIGGIGIALLLVSLVLGDLLDGAFEGVGGDLFSGAALAGFLGAFGFAGVLSLTVKDDVVVAIVVGLVVGLLIGALVGWVTLKLKEGGDEANVRTTSLVGRPATLINAIPEGGYGEVSMVASGHITKLNARAQQPLPAGTPVTITAVLSATSVQVEPTVTQPQFPTGSRPSGPIFN